MSTSTNSCARAEDLVTYLYNEATQDEAKEFETHVEQCASCRLELVTFGDVREAMDEWRQQALGSLASPAFEANAARALAPAMTSTRKRSGLAALREFFALSPMWMRAATAVVAVAFCALAAIAVAYFVRQPQTVIVEKHIKSGYSDEEVKAKIDEAIKRQNELQVKEVAISSPEQIGVVGIGRRAAQPQIKRSASGISQASNNVRRQPTLPRTRVQPSEELASTDYLPFTASDDDKPLPTLTDLVNDAN
ncbi:MAG TPA: zf-HC2 domain-containing protein [Pyrinomonadaceae bacterium]